MQEYDSTACIESQFDEESEDEREHFEEFGRHAEMSRKTEHMLIDVERRAVAVERAYMVAEKKYSTSKSQHCRNDQGRLVQSLAAQERLVDEKYILLEEVHTQQHTLLDAQHEVAKLQVIAKLDKNILIPKERCSANNRLLHSKSILVDWDSRMKDSRRNLVEYANEGWTMIPEFCYGKMCNSSPLVGDNNKKYCVICKGSGNGEDGAYVPMRSVTKKSNKENLKQNESKDAANQEVVCKILQGWQLLKSPCPKCVNPLMSKTAAGPKVCVFCNYSEEDTNFCDDTPYGGSSSITLDLPDNFDGSDPTAIEQLVRSATRSISSRRKRCDDSIPVTVSLPWGHSRQDSHRSGGSDAPRDDNDPNTASLSRSHSRQRSYRSSGSTAPHGMSAKNRPPRVTSSSPSRAIPQQRIPLVAQRRRSNSTPPHLTTERKHSGPSLPTHGSSRSHSRSRSRHSSLDDDKQDLSSVANTLGAILSQIESCKNQLNKPINATDPNLFREGLVKRRDAEVLFKKLSTATNAIRNANTVLKCAEEYTGK